jgi:murein tripeptide amidase MpaA
MALNISSAFDGGNIVVESVRGNSAVLSIRKDSKADFYQWFHFRVAGAKGSRVALTIQNAGGSAYPQGWKGYKVRYSTDRQDWRQEASTRYEDGKLIIEHECAEDIVWFAYFAPYSMERHHDMVARMSAMPGVTHVELGQSLDGQPMDCLRIGTGRTQVWLYGRQHPGETMAEWWLEGALEVLTDEADVHARMLRDKCTIHVVPNMNPDGSYRGHLRTNAAGADLNREWAEPSKERSPEVLCVLNEMRRTGVHWAFDVHGDEAVPANFVAGFEGIPEWEEAKGGLFVRYRTQLTARTHDFQDKLGYPPAKPGEANLKISTNQVANQFRCVALTLEMPFKDHDAHAVPSHGWNPVRCKSLARDCLAVLADLVD